jgi:hypothetical protein
VFESRAGWAPAADAAACLLALLNRRLQPIELAPLTRHLYHARRGPRQIQLEPAHAAVAHAQQQRAAARRQRHPGQGAGGCGVALSIAGQAAGTVPLLLLLLLLLLVVVGLI